MLLELLRAAAVALMGRSATDAMVGKLAADAVRGILRLVGGILVSSLRTLFRALRVIFRL